ncbi:MAG: winged helix-turn-helix domain-containing protein [Moraxellaceae bacterium]
MSTKNSGKLQIRSRLLHTTDGGEEIAMGPGKAELLGAIAETGSISGAARKMGMSYRRAWLLVDTMNRCFKTPLVSSAAGGTQGGGATLTTLGKEVLSIYQQLQIDVDAAAHKQATALTKLLAKL